jgi:hypothetical protein
MAWTKTSQRGYLVATEELTLPSLASTDVSSSVIDWIPPGKNFVVLANLGATNIANNVTIDIDACTTPTGTFGQIKADLIAAGMDTVMAGAVYLVGTYGEAPYYKVRVDPAGPEAGESFKIAVVVAN